MRDRLFALASLALAAGYYLSARTIQASELADTTGPAGLPVIYAAVLAGLSIVLLVTSRRSSGGLARVADHDSPPIWKGRAALTLLVGILYVAAVPVVGYLAGITLLIAATAGVHGASLNIRTAMVAVSGAAVLWLLFVWLLGIPQPSGWWPDLVSLLITGAGPASS